MRLSTDDTPALFIDRRPASAFTSTGRLGERARHTFQRGQRISPALRLAGSERRVFTRVPSNGRASARREDHTVTARRSPFLELDLRDVSAGGLSALSDVPLAAGERLTVRLPDARMKLGSTMPGHTLSGHVLRCEASATGYRVALMFDDLPAA